jgi:hypothetical protein
MPICANCGSTNIRQGLCGDCGAPQAVIIVGQKESEAPVHYTAAGLVLTEILEEEPPSALPSFVETTSMDPARPVRGNRAAPEPAPPKARGGQTIVNGTLCPACGTDLPDPIPTFCDACGNRLPRSKKIVEGSAGEGSKKCRQCGFRNGASRFNCTNCGERLPAD